MDLLKYYKIIYKYRRWTASALATGLLLNKGLPYIFPVTIFMPFNAATDCESISFDHQLWLLRQTKKDLGINKAVLPFITTSADCRSAGFLAFSKWKEPCVLGFPKNFFCSNLYDVEELNIKVGNSRKSLVSEGGPNEVALLESLLFSEAAQKFAAARQLISLRDNWAIWQSLLSPLFVAIGYIICFRGAKILFKGSKSVALTKIIKYQIAAIFVVWVLCKLVHLQLKHAMINSTDRKAALISKEYAEGGVEYYQNIRKSNQAQRTLLGSKGERIFTAYGNVNDGLLFNWSGPSLTKREKNVQTILDQYSNK